METETSWEQRHGNLARPTQKDQDRLREIFLGQLGEFLTPTGSH